MSDNNRNNEILVNNIYKKIDKYHINIVDDLCRYDRSRTL